MNFIEKLDDINIEISRMTPYESRFRMFKGVRINDDLFISIQASRGHYCTPRETLSNLEEYTHMEFALMNEKGDFVSVREACPHFSKLDEIETYFEGSVYPYVPVGLINDLFNELNA